MTVPGRGRSLRPSDAVAALLIAATFAAGVVAYDAVPAAMSIHYTPPGGVYYGLETVPKALGLFAVPLASLTAFVLARWLPAAVGVVDLSDADARYYRLAVVLLVATLTALQAALVLLNVL